MDRRMYRGNGRNNCGPCNKNQNSPICDDITGGYTPDEDYDKDIYEGEFDRYPIGMCYVPWQRFRNLYENEFVALANGTLFKELDLKWYGRSCK